MSQESCGASWECRVSVQCERVKEEPGLEPEARVQQEAWEPVKQEPSEAAAGLYAGHEVKGELVLGPTTLQPPDAALPASGTQSPTTTNTDNKTSPKRKEPSTKRSKRQPIDVQPASISVSDDQPLPPPPKRIFSASDLDTGKADDIFDSLRTENEDVDSDIEEDNDPQDYASEAARDVLQPAVEQWLDVEDGNADRTLRDLLPPDHLTFDWNSDPDTFTGKREEFRVTPGPTFTVTEDMTTLELFLKFFDDDLLDLIVTHTNEHARRNMDNNTCTHARVNFWKDTDRGEIVAFLAVIILQGCAPLSVEVDYWRENGYLTLKYFKDIMTYNRFALLKKFMQFTDIDSPMTELTADERKLRKISPLLDHLNRKFSELYLPGQNVAVGESLLNWHGRLSFAQRTANKAAKVGIRSQELCESSTGYLWKFSVYTGKRRNDQQTDSIEETNRQMNAQETDITDEQIRIPDKQTDKSTNTDGDSTNATALILQNLVKPLLNKGYTLIVDNFYNAPLLARYLKGEQTDCFGPLRVQREFVPETFKKTLKSDMRSGEVAQSFCRDMSVVMWRDANIVSMLSTYHGNVGKEYASNKKKPDIVSDYNNVMDGVDKKDRLLSTFKMERTKNLAWHKKVFRRLLNVTVLNAYVMFKTQHSISHRAFRLALAGEMIKWGSPPKIDQPMRVQTKSLVALRSLQRPTLVGNHFIGPSQSKYARCIWCRKSRTKYFCKQCHVALCLEMCFEDFHTVD